MLPDHRAIADALLDSRRYRLADLPLTVGLYGLYDHEGMIQDVGETACAKGFKDRIYSRHAAGSEDGRQKYMTAYRFEPLLTRSTRTAFIRAHCLATVFPLSPEHIGYRKALERAVIIELRSRGYPLPWNDRRNIRIAPESISSAITLLAQA